MHAVGAFLRFWYDFIIGDDWTIALVVAVALVVIWLVRQTVVLWWLLPLAVAGALGLSLYRATR